MTVLIYDDYKNSHTLLCRSLRRIFGAGRVGFCDHEDILGGRLDQSVSLFVMPGGADLYYTERLDGAGNAAIRGWVESGGTYLGICAGAYYACSAIAWAQTEGTAAICEPRELALLPAIATGPVYDFIEDGDFRKSWQASALLSYDDGDHAQDSLVYYHGGPVFHLDEEHNDVKVLARYASLPDAPAAIIERRIGKGKAILCSPHLELAPADLQAKLYRAHNPSYQWERRVVTQLMPHETSMAELWTHLIKRCVEPCRWQDAA